MHDPSPSGPTAFNWSRRGSTSTAREGAAIARSIKKSGIVFVIRCMDTPLREMGSGQTIFQSRGAGDLSAGISNKPSFLQQPPFKCRSSSRYILSENSSFSVKSQIDKLPIRGDGEEAIRDECKYSVRMPINSFFTRGTAVQWLLRGAHFECVLFVGIRPFNSSEAFTHEEGISLLIVLLFFLLAVLTAASVCTAAAPRYDECFPDVPGYRTLVCDLHMHTVFSDGNVWPTVPPSTRRGGRGSTVWRLLITSEYQPHKGDVPTNHNRPNQLAAGSAKAHNLILVLGAEITPPTRPPATTTRSS